MNTQRDSVARELGDHRGGQTEVGELAVERQIQTGTGLTAPISVTRGHIWSSASQIKDDLDDVGPGCGGGQDV